MNGSGPGRPGRRAGSGPPQGVIAAVVVLVALMVIGAAVVVGIRLGGSYLGEQTATGPVPTSTKTTTRTPPAPRTSSTTSEATTTRRATATCDARAINRDLGYPGSGSRIIDCGSGWAVMASEHSGDPYWVSFRGGRWQAERGISMYLFTCPDEAIARGVPAWMADKHLTCTSLRSSTSASRSSGTRTSAPRTSVSPSVRPSPSLSPSASPSSSASSSPSVAPTQTSGGTTTTTSPSPSQVAEAEEFE